MKGRLSTIKEIISIKHIHVHCRIVIRYRITEGDIFKDFIK
jgi:hypothetical protein